MAFVGINISPEIGKLFSKIDVPGDKTNTNEFHITLLYFDGKFSLSEVRKSLKIIYDIASKTQPFVITSCNVSHFPGHKEEKCAIIAKIESSELHQVHDQLAKEFKQAKIDFSKKFKKYNPHITLSYSKEEVEDFNIVPISFTVSEITL